METVRVLWRGPPNLGCTLRRALKDREIEHSTPDLPPSPWVPMASNREKCRGGRT